MYGHNREAKKRLDEINEQLKQFTRSFKNTTKQMKDDNNGNNCESQADDNAEGRDERNLQISTEVSDNKYDDTEDFIINNKSAKYLSIDEFKRYLSPKFNKNYITHKKETNNITINDNGNNIGNSTQRIEDTDTVTTHQQHVTETEMDEVEKRYNERLREINATITSLKQEADQEAEIYMNIVGPSLRKEE